MPLRREHEIVPARTGQWSHGEHRGAQGHMRIQSLWSPAHALCPEGGIRHALSMSGKGAESVFGQVLLWPTGRATTGKAAMTWTRRSMCPCTSQSQAAAPSGVLRTLACRVECQSAVGVQIGDTEPRLRERLGSNAASLYLLNSAHAPIMRGKGVIDGGPTRASRRAFLCPRIVQQGWKEERQSEEKSLRTRETKNVPTRRRLNDHNRFFPSLSVLHT
jgi:hypothetical protein